MASSSNLIPSSSPVIPGNPGFPPAPSSVPPLGSFGDAPSGTSFSALASNSRDGGFAIQWDNLEAVIGMPAAYLEAADEAIQEACTEIAEEMQTYAQSEAPWTDRTGTARASLAAYVTQLDELTTAIILEQGVDYGLYLETVSGGQFAIIQPTIDEFAPLLAARVMDKVDAKVNQ